jgi:hypothetical protein
MASDRVTVTATHTVHVARAPEHVFDFTQDYARRAEWDQTVKSAQVVSEEPRVVQMVLQGMGEVTLRYQLYRRGERTSAAFEVPASRVFLGGGGSWSYVARDRGTDWTDTSTLELRASLLGRLTALLIRATLGANVRKAMNKAKELMEAEAPAAPIGG